MTSLHEDFSAVILAAGKGTRMRSQIHKVLHPVGGRPMLLHLLHTLSFLKPQKTVIVAGDRKEQIEEAVGDQATIVSQMEQLGTAHAVLQTEAALATQGHNILILFGDVPLVSSATIARLLQAIDTAEGPAISVLTFQPEEAGSYGRVLIDEQGQIVKMVEAKDATPDELEIRLCNSGLMAVKSSALFPLLKQVENDNAAGEYYLPDIVAIAQKQDMQAMAIKAENAEVLGVNSRADLALAEAAFQTRRRQEIMAAGVTLIAPETVFFSADTSIGQDTVVGPYVVFGPGVEVGEAATIHSHCHITGASIAEKAEIGPFARLRPGTRLEAGSKVGNFVETKKMQLGKGAKANHLSYLGDSIIGENANIGAGTITCNYDGFNKFQTIIGKGAFIGSNSALVAPVTIEDGAIVGAGSTITQNVPKDSLALARAPQQKKPGWAARFRTITLAKKGK